LPRLTDGSPARDADDGATTTASPTRDADGHPTTPPNEKLTKKLISKRLS
jgi:hypothetical protein